MDIQLVGIVAGACLIMTFFAVFMPKSFAKLIGFAFSFGKIGIHFSRFYRDERDVLGNLFLTIGIAYSVFFGLIPYQIEKITFSIVYWLFFILVLNQYYRVYGEEKLLNRMSSITALCIMASINYMAAGGFLNNFKLMSPSVEFIRNIFNGNIFTLTYFFAHEHFICYLTTTALYLTSFYCLLSQFKYLRLEDHFKARNSFFLWAKIIIIAVIMVGISLYCYDLFRFIFNF